MNIINISFLKKIFSEKKSLVILVVVFVVGIMMLTLSDTNNEHKTQEMKPDTSLNISENDSSKKLEKELEDILSEVEGVGNVRVMVRFSTSAEKIPFTDKSSSSEKIIRTSYGDDAAPFISKEVYAMVEGVLIVAQGGNNEKIKSEITLAVSEMLGIPIHKVNILKMHEGD